MGTYNDTMETSIIYATFFTELADKRTNSWFLMEDPFPTCIILAFWMYFVLIFGPTWMKDKQPFNLRTILIIYNFLQIIASVYVFVRGGQLCWFANCSWKCEPVDFSTNHTALEVAGLFHFYYLVKITELLDTIFFVLRKKNRQINFLHVYHHTVMPVVAWFGTKYLPGGHGAFIGFLNSFIHIIMYSYYILAALGPSIQKYLWWKKHITTMQLLQFCCIFIHNSQLLFHDCGYPYWVFFVTAPNAIFFYQLFTQFYKDAYLKNRYKVLKKEANYDYNEDTTDDEISNENGKIVLKYKIN